MLTLFYFPSQVHPVASLSIIPLSLAQATPNSRYHAFPLGYSAQFIAHLHDNIGRRFDYAEIPLSHRLNRHDTVILSPESGNTTFLVKAAREGHVLLKIWMTSSPHVADYIRIRVGYAILPSLATVPLGSLVCFSTHLTEDKPGWWSVGEDSVMQLEPGTGVGRAVGVGTTVVYHKVKDTTDTHTEITVAKVAGVVLSSNSTHALGTFTNGHRPAESGDYLLPVAFNMPGGEQFSPVHTSPNKECLKVAMGIEKLPPLGKVYYIQQVLFDCRAELQDRRGMDVMTHKYVVAQPTFDPYTGEYFCKLAPVESPGSSESLSVKDELRLSVVVEAYDFARSYSVLSEKQDVPFEPGFYLSRREVIISAMDLSSELTVTGLTHQLNTIKVREGGGSGFRGVGGGGGRETCVVVYL